MNLNKTDGTKFCKAIFESEKLSSLSPAELKKVEKISLLEKEIDMDELSSILVQCVNLKKLTLTNPRHPNWDFLANLTLLEYVLLEGAKSLKTAIEFMSNLPRLTTLIVINSPLMDDSIKMLKKSNIKMLGLPGTLVTDSSAESLSKINLEELDLAWTLIGDAGARKLFGMELKAVRFGAYVTEGCIKEFKAVNPTCKVYRNWEHV